MHQKDRFVALKRVAIFAGLPGPRLSQLAATCNWREFDAGQQILDYRENSNEVFFLASGRVRVVVYSAEGKAVLFTDLSPGAMFGEVAAIDRAERSASVEVLEHSSVASLTADQFEGLLLSEPTVAVATLRHVVSEVRRLSERVLDFSTLVVQNRVRIELLRLASDAGPQQGQALLSPSPSLSDIADRISTHREAVSRELSRLASTGLLRREGSNLRITDVRRLAKLVREAKDE
jgi:CRP-like cAMP-binding protein